MKSFLENAILILNYIIDVLAFIAERYLVLHRELSPMEVSCGLS